MKKYNLWAGVLGLSLGFSCMGRGLRAEDRITPLLPPPIEAGPSAAPPLAPPASTDGQAPAHINPDEALVERLSAICFEFAPGIPTPTPEADKDCFGLSGIPLSAAGDPPAGVENKVPALAAALADACSPLSRALADALASPFTWRHLDVLLAETTKAAREAGWSLAQAFAPEQELSSRTLRVAVVPVVLEGIDVEGARWSRPARLENPFCGRIGEIVNLRDYARPLVFINQHPFRQATPLLAPGEAAGTTRLKLTVVEEKPWRVFSGFETTHSRLSGVGRVSAGFMAAAPWKTEDILTAQYSKDSDFNHLDSVALSYRAALPWGHFLTATGLWARSDSSPARLMDYRTTDWLAGLEYTAPLPEFRGWSHEASLGWEWRRFEGQYFLFGEAFDDGSKTDMAPFSLGWRGWRPDRAGLTSLFGKASWNPGDYLGGSMRRAAYESHRAGTGPAFAAFSWEARRDWRLPADFGFQNRAWGQLSGDRLADPARFFLGGNRTLRGYRESELAGDGGWGVTLELTTPAWRGPPPRCEDGDGGKPPAGGGPLEFRLAGFWDWGQVYRKGPREAWERERQTGSGAGLGVRMKAGPWVDVRADYAWRLRDTGVREDDVRGYFHLSANVRF